MSSYTVIGANIAQSKKLYEKHMWFKVYSSYSYDDEDNIGFVTVYTITGKTIEYQLRNDEPCFVEFTGFYDIRYDISYPEKMCMPMYEKLKKWGINAQKKFWKGGSI